jgi:hypothetical protein
LRRRVLAAAVAFGEPGVEDLLRDLLRGEPQAERQHVGVVPPARPARGLRVRAERGADAGNLVGRNADAGAGPAADDAEVGVARRDGARDADRGGPPGLFLVGGAAEARHGVAARLEKLDQTVDETRPFVGSEGDAHARTIAAGAPSVLKVGGRHAPGLPIL